MNIKRKTLVILTVAFLGLLFTVLVLARVLLYDNLEKTEARIVQKDMMRGLIILQNEMTVLSALAGDYAGWDDTYAFVKDGNPAYIRSNYVDETFAKQRLNMLLIIDLQGRLVYGTGFDLENHRKTMVSQAMRDYVRSASPLLGHSYPQSALTGFLALPEGPLMFASRAIVTSDYGGPIRGTLIMGRFLNAAEQRRLSELTRLDIHFQPVKSAGSSSGAQVIPFDADNMSLAFRPVSDKLIQGQTLLPDAFGRPVLEMTANMPRLFWEQGKRTLAFLITAVFGAALLFAAIIYFLLERLVLSRVKNMNDELRTLGAEQQTGGRVSAKGRDELALLARSINNLILVIETHREAIRLESDRYRSVVEDQMDFICRFNLQGTILFANEALGRYLNQPPNALLERSFYEMLPWENDGEIRQGIASLDGGIQVKTFDARLTFPGNREQWHRWTVRALLGDHGKVTEYQAVGRDITEGVMAEAERKAMEDRLFQMQKMDAIGTLAGGIAHDFNNILMGIGGYVSLMLYDIEANHPHFQKLKAIEQQIKSAASLTRDLLGFARGGAYQMRPTDLNHLLKRTGSIFGRTRKEIEIRYRLVENIWMVQADAGQIDQVLMNLFVNASQAMPAGGNLYLETQAAFLKIPTGSYVQVSVTDEGVGMDEETKERVFEPFFTTRDREKRGVGLGLASVYGIIRNHGGMINVYTEKGVGTTFRIYLPAFEPTASDRGEREALEQRVLKGTEGILVVEDEELLMDVAVKMLEVMGYRVFTAKSGAEALERYHAYRNDIDLIMLDMVMPGMGGEETFRKLKEIRPDIKVILASGYSLNEQATRIMEGGCCAFLQKPHNTVELSRTIRDVLSQSA